MLFYAVTRMYIKFVHLNGMFSYDTYEISFTSLYNLYMYVCN